MVGDDDEVAFIKKRYKRVAESLDVRVVQRRIHLVEHAERRRLGLEDRHEQRHRRERLFPAGELADDARLLPRRLGLDLKTRFEPIRVPVFIGQKDDVGAAASEQLAEHAIRPGEMLAHGIERCLEQPPACFVEFVDQGLQLTAGGIDVVNLRCEIDVALFQHRLFFQRVEVDVPELANVFAQGADLGFDRVGLDKLEVIGATRLTMRGVRLDEVQLQIGHGPLFQGLALDLDFPAVDFGSVVVSIDFGRVGPGVVELVGRLLNTPGRLFDLALELEERGLDLGLPAVGVRDLRHGLGDPRFVLLNLRRALQELFVRYFALPAGLFHC